MSEVRVIKRYANRKLYDTQHSRYVTLDQIAEMIRRGDDVKIVDNKTKEDLTSVTLAQIIFEKEKKQKSFLPLQTMRNIIQSGGESITHLVTEAQRRVNTLTRTFKKEGEEGEEGMVGEDGELVVTDDAAQSQDELGADDTYAGKGPVGNLVELREWIVHSQRTIDDWQRRVDGTIRNVVEGMSPFHGLQKDLSGLKARIMELEQKIQRMGQAAATAEDGERE